MQTHKHNALVKLYDVLCNHELCRQSFAVGNNKNLIQNKNNYGGIPNIPFIVGLITYVKLAGNKGSK